MEEFDFKLRISPSDTQFKNLIGIEKYNQKKAETFKRDRFSCRGCGYRPLDEPRALTILQLHLIELNEQSPEDSECNTLCMACHSTQHIDVAIEKDWVQLVNSTHSQRELINICRINTVHDSIRENNTRHLKIAPLDFLQKMKNGELMKDTKAKVIFTSKFEWGDL